MIASSFAVNRALAQEFTLSGSKNRPLIPFHGSTMVDLIAFYGRNHNVATLFLICASDGVKLVSFNQTAGAP
jgi:hypothetical protein